MDWLEDDCICYGDDADHPNSFCSKEATADAILLAAAQSDTKSATKNTIPCPDWIGEGCTCYADEPTDPLLLIHTCPDGAAGGSPPGKVDCPGWLSTIIDFVDAAECACYDENSPKLSCSVDPSKEGSPAEAAA
jgi:hypothetical protein